MPYLHPDDRKRLLGPTGHTCSRCRAIIAKQYCRECDEFFFLCECPRTEHVGHRTYESGQPTWEA